MSGALFLLGTAQVLRCSGYFLVDAKDLDEVIGIAARIPGARMGTVEIRPVMEIAGLPTV
ncbi:MAG TPA: YciI family protein [Gemmataceae bacterium]|nr:YciI family protein [Gemmataceae bacterium]